MLSEEDTKRVVDEAGYVVDFMLGLINSRYALHERYLAEKVEKARSCIDFMTSVLEEYADV